MSSKIFAPKYQKAGKWRLIMCVGVTGPRVTFMLLFGSVTASGWTKIYGYILKIVYFQIKIHFIEGFETSIRLGSFGFPETVTG